MSRIPAAALILGLAGVLPFAAGVLAETTGYAPVFGVGWLVIVVAYALTILAFMSGCIWAFAARQGDAAGYGLSTVPALAGFFLVVPGLADPEAALPVLLTGFAVLFPLFLLLDLRADSRGQTPGWWVPLRLLLTGLVTLCLLIGMVL